MFDVCFSSAMAFTNRKRKNETCIIITDYSSEVNFVDLQIRVGTSLTTLCSRNAKRSTLRFLENTKSFAKTTNSERFVPNADMIAGLKKQLMRARSGLSWRQDRRRLTLLYYTKLFDQTNYLSTMV